MTYLCVPIYVTDTGKAQRDIAAAAEAGAEMVELRIDELTDAEAVRQLVSGSMLPCIVTCRPTWEGGHSQLREDERLALLDAGSAANASYVDLELEGVRRWASAHGGEPLPLHWLKAGTPREKRSGLIVSFHDFAGRPARLNAIIAEMNVGGGDVNKIVWTARSIRDNLEAFELLRTRQKPTIALCMGEAGIVSRVLAKKFGAFLTFASLSQGAGTASGQVPIAEMKDLYRWDAIRADTKVYGVVAQPVMHSLSPAIHNAAFNETGYNGVYLPLLVEKGYESFKAFMETFARFPGLDLAGLSVTIPHKENALRYLQERGAELEPLAASIGAVNTIIIGARETNPTFRGINTDYAAILDSITAKLGIKREDLAGRYRVAVIGAGGTGRTAVAALAHYGADVRLYNRTLERADELAREFDGRNGRVAAYPLDELANGEADIYLNTTSVGMYPKVDESPLGERAPRMRRETVVFDTVYNPMKTRLLREAEAAGAQTISGVEMFMRQAAAQFEAWTGQSAPRQVMRQVIERRLASA